MTEITQSNIDHRRRRGVRRMKRHSLRTDMTPMVDLGFLLITFFVFTAQLRKPFSLKLSMPKESNDSTFVGNSNALTILLDENDHVYYYHGNWKEASEKHQIFPTNLSMTDGFGQVVRDKQNWLDLHNQKEKRKGLMLLIKAGKGASYKNVIDALDEALVHVVTKYTLLSVAPEEAAWMKNQKK